mgnify:CR=1 FL=1
MNYRVQRAYEEKIYKNQVGIKVECFASKADAKYDLLLLRFANDVIQTFRRDDLEPTQNTITNPIDDRMRNSYTFNCKHCNRVFHTNNKKQKCCSRACSNSLRRTLPRIPCPICSTIFAKTQEAHVTCSRSCQFALRRIKAGESTWEEERDHLKAH